MDTADILERAADALWMYGRCTTTLCDESGSMCVVGAVVHVAGEIDVRTLDNDVDWAMDRYRSVLTPLADRLPHVAAANLDRVWWWNDGLPITPEHDAEVIDTLRSVAKDLRNEGVS